ncbi:MAG: ABC transporter ATP-binding protein [Candidatus Woesearchaeota archaeon]
MTVLETDGLVAGKGTFTVDCNDLFVEERSILGVLGRSGSGKTTMIETIVGLHHPRKGRVLIDGSPVHNHMSELGFVPQSSALWEYLSVVENLTVFGRIYGVRRSEIKRRTKVILGRLELEGHEHKRINQLSGGMRRRADLAVGLIHMPRVLVLDEPFTGLDPQLRSFLWEFLNEIAQAGSSIMISSHLIEDLERYATHFALVANQTVHRIEKDELRAVFRGEKR